MKKRLLIFMTILLYTVCYSQTTFVDNFIEYEVTSSSPPYEVKVIGNTGSGGAIDIPATVIFNLETYSVTAIENQAFFSSNLTSVIIPDSVLTIGSSAFGNNSNLSMATIGNSVTSIANSAFIFADLSSIVIPDSVISIGNQAFDGNSLTSVTLGTSLTSISTRVFYNNSITNITLPQSLLTIGGEAFSGNQLTSIIIPENVTTIEAFAFSGNPITTVTSLNQTPPPITNQVFGGRANMDLIIPTGTAGAYSAVPGAKWQSFKTISDSSFQTFTINKIVYEVTSTINNTAKTVDFLVASNSSNNAVVIPSTVTSNSIVYTVTEIEDYSFRGGGTIPQNISSVVIPDGITRIGEEAFRFNGLTSLTIPDSVEIIGNFSFWQNINLSNVTLGSNITDLGNQSFSDCNIATIVLPNTLTTIGFQAFLNNQLSDVTIPSTVTSIGFEAFKGNSLASVTSLATTPPAIFTGSLDTFDTRSGINLNIPTGTMGVYVTDPGALWTGFNMVTEAPAPAVGDTFVVDFITYEITSIIPDTVVVIDYDIAGGTVVNIPTTVDNNSVTYNVTEIGDNAFFNKQLTSAIIPNSIVFIGYQSFRNNSLTDIVIPGSVNTIGSAAFTSNSNLATVIIEDGVVTINNSAFIFCGITSLTIPNSVVSIGSQAFDSSNLTSLTFGSGLISIGNSAFKNNQLTNIVFGSSLESIAFGAFENNQLTSITIPENVTTIQGTAFTNNALTSVTSLAIAPPTIVTGAFDTFDARGGIDLTIPAGTMGAYVTDPGALWTDFNMVTLDTSDFEIANDISVINTVDGLQVTSSNIVQLKDYSIYNMSGATVAFGKESEINTSFLSSGIYIVKLNFNKGTVTKKFVID